MFEYYETDSDNTTTFKDVSPNVWSIFDGALRSFLLDDSLKVKEENKGNKGDIKWFECKDHDAIAVTYYDTTRTLRVQGQNVKPNDELAEMIVHVLNLCIYLFKLQESNIKSS